MLLAREWVTCIWDGMDMWDGPGGRGGCVSGDAARQGAHLQLVLNTRQAADARVVIQVDSERLGAAFEVGSLD